MAKAEFQDVFPVDKDKLFAVITRYEDYPKFVEGVQSVKVEKAASGARVSYKVSMMKDISYTLDHVEDAPSGRVEWTLVDSDSFKSNSGIWELRSVGPGKTDVKYQLEVEFKIPIPGFVLNRLVKSQLPSMVKSFVERATKGK
ncbi:MAG: type II toxin-antitoxin system RatA family toxin [Bdellovibrionota bacterium]